MPHDPTKPAGGGGAAKRSPPVIESGEADEAARVYYERLEQAGKLVNVDSGSDLADLPPHVTHVRYPDGTVERVGFSAL